ALRPAGRIRYGAPTPSRGARANPVEGPPSASGASGAAVQRPRPRSRRRRRQAHPRVRLPEQLRREGPSRRATPRGPSPRSRVPRGARRLPRSSARTSGATRSRLLRESSFDAWSQPDPAHGWQQIGGEHERDGTEHELHDDARLPVLPVLEQTARNGRSGGPLKDAGGPPFAHGPVTRAEARTAAGRQELAAVVPAVEPVAVTADRLAGRDGEQRDRRTDEGDGRRRWSAGRVGVDRRGKEEAVPKR